MPQRLRLYDYRVSRGPALMGRCQGDLPLIADDVNTFQRRLLYCKEAGDEGFHGTWAEVVFNVSKTDPYLTLPREIGRLEAVNICSRTIPIQNQFYEYLQFGNGSMPKTFPACAGLMQAYSRNNAVTFTDLSKPPQLLRFYSDALDAGRRIMVSGLDANNNTIYTQDGQNRVQGVFTALVAPFVTDTYQFNKITGIQKDTTAMPVQVYQVDPVTGDEVLLLTMEPGETTAWYRRYRIDPIRLACCCNSTETTIQISAMAKLELIPARVDTDWLLFQNLEALIEEGQSTRLSEMDTPAAKQMSRERHQAAVAMLNGELTHVYGTDSPAVGFFPFGNAHLSHHKVGSLL